MLMLLLWCGTAQAVGAKGRISLHWTVVTRSALGAARADGGRWVAYQQSAGRTRVLDVRTGRRYEHPNPAGCRHLRAVGGGEVLLSCDAAPWYVVVDAASGAAHPIAGLTDLPKGSDPSVCSDNTPVAIGTRWLGVTGGCYHGYTYTFLDWRTGRVARVTDVVPRVAVDLDAAEVLRPLCPSLGPESSEVENADLYGDVPHAYVDGAFAVASPAYPLRPVLARCGTSRHVSVAVPGMHERELDHIELGGGVLMWTSGVLSGVAAVSATRIDPHARSLHDRVAHGRSPGPWLVHAGPHLYAAAPNADATTTTIWTATVGR
jgi:hypothetical protein